MVDREKVMKGLRCLSNPYIQDMDERDCENCKYDNSCCFLDVTADALSLLEAQEPRARVMALEEVEDALDTVVWVDRPLFDNSSSEYALIDAYSRKTQIVELRYPFCDKDYRERSDYAAYGKTWRCWTSRPTDEQRAATPWSELKKEG